MSGGQFIKPDNTVPDSPRGFKVIISSGKEGLPPSESEAGRVQHTFVGEAPKIRWSGGTE